MKKLNPLSRVLCCFFAVYMALPASMSAQLLLTPPAFPTTNTVRVTLTGAEATNAHIVFSTPDLNTNFNSWTRVITGAVGQTTFDLTKTANSAMFYRATTAPVGIPTVATPVFTPGGGSYPVGTNVTITCDTAGAAIYYTTNGATPTTLDNFIYSGGSVFLNCSVTLKAKAFAYGYDDSAVATASYSINCGPIVSAGSQQIISGSSTTLQGTVIDDGLTGGGIKFTNWSKVSGPGTVTFGNANQTNTTATFGSDGIYVLQLRASDGQYTNSAQVTIAVNPTLSVSITAPENGSGYTVPTNILLQASAASSSGSVTQLLFYANSTLIGEGIANPSGFGLQWKSVPAGNLTLTAIAVSDDVNNFSLASDPINITVDWPTNVGQVTLATTDLQVPVAGFPITINRQYNTRYGVSGSFGNNGRLDYEQIKIEASSSFASGWQGLSSGFTFCVGQNVQHLITVSLNENEKYYFVAEIAFDQSSSSCVNATQPPNCYNFYTVHLQCTPIGLGQLAVADPGADVGMDDELSGWNRPLTAVYFDDFGFPESDYNPDFSQFTFTAPDGTRLGFNGDGTVAWKSDRNGNALYYSYSGITHSSGKQVTFTRDGNNRITEIYDPTALAISGVPAAKYFYDGNGNLTNFSRLVQRSPEVYESLTYTYTNASFPTYVTAVIDARNIAQERYEYDSNGRLFKQYDALNRAKTYTYDLANRRQTVTDRLGNTTVQDFTESGRLGSVRNAAGEVTTYSYDEQGRKISETNPLGAKTGFAYDERDQLAAVTNEVGSVSSSTYNDFGQVLVSINPACGCTETVNEYDSNGNLVATTNAVGVITLYEYDSQGNRLTTTNAYGRPEQTISHSTYDSYGYLSGVTSPLGYQTDYTYDDNGNKLTEVRTRTLPGGSAESLTNQWVYDAMNRIIATIAPGPRTNLVFYDNIGKQSATVDALGRTNRFYYDAVTMLTNITYPDGLNESFTYDAEERQVTTKDRAGRITSNYYDPMGRVVLIAYPDGSSQTTTYDAAGRVRFISQVPIPPGPFIPGPTPIVTARYTYDAAGRQLTVTNAHDQGRRFAYDANGNLTNVIDELGRSTGYVVDGLARQIKIIFPDSTSESYGYDGLGRKVAVTNQAGVITRFGFDSLGRLVAATNAFGTAQQMVMRYAYDEVGNLLQQIDSLNHTNKFEYDSRGQRTKEVMPGSQSAGFAYDAAGNLTRYTNFTGVVITNQYDALNRLTNKSSAGGYKVSFAYSPTGQRTNMVDASGTTGYTYDSRDRLLTKVTPQGTLTYIYDEFGNLATIQSSSSNGTLLKYFYDELNRVTNVVDRFTNNTFYAFDAIGNVQSYRYQNNVTNTYSYNSLNRLTNITVRSASGTIASLAYRLGAAGNRTNLVETVNSASRTNAWSYDPLYRLTNEIVTAASGGTISYKYDGIGNRTNRTSTVSGLTNQTFTYNSNDQLTTDSYDGNGNTTNSAGIAYRYDAENRLTNYNNGAVMFVYDGDGIRVRKIVGTTTNYYLMDDRNPTGQPQVLEELTTVGGTPDRLYTYGLDLISQRQSSGTTSFYGYDGNGNVRFLTATNGVISDTYAYDAFGTIIASSGSTPNNYRYTGEQFDSNLGFYYLRARYMNPNTGRFWTRDSFAGDKFDPPSLHRYTYVQNNPVNMIDPTGNQTSAAEVGLTGVIIGRIASQLALATVKALVTACALQLTATVVANQAFDIDTSNVPGPCTFRNRSQGYRILFHYSALPTLSGGQIWSGTFLTDNSNLTAYEAKHGLGIPGPVPTTLYAIKVKPNEISGGTPIQPSPQATLPVDAREWATLVSLPLTRIVYTRPVL